MKLITALFSKTFWKVVCVCVVFAYIGFAVRNSAAYALGPLDNARSLKWAVALDPSNANYRDRLGQYFMFTEHRSDSAIEEYQTAVTLNPHIAGFWLDLATAYASAGSGDRQVQALEMALQVDPRTPLVSQQVANAFLIRGDLHRALGMYRGLLETDPWEVDSTLEVCWQATHDTKVMMSEALPLTPSVYLSFLNLLIHEHQLEDAQQVWSGLMSLRQPFDPASAQPYVEYLLAQHYIDRARWAWENLGQVNPAFRPYVSSATNLVVNGGFEEKMLNAGFDWRYVATPHTVLALDSEQFHSGSRALSVTFDGQAATDSGLSQIIPVKPNTEYSFTAYAMAADISAAHGPQLLVSDADTKSSLLRTDELLGTSSWTRLGGTFRTGPKTGLVSLTIARALGATDITGKFWIDDLSMAEVNEF